MKIPAALVLLAAATALAAAEPTTEIRYLSGRGPKDAVPWEFTVSGGRRAGEKTTIPVPSNWELQGFGTYNYGQEANKADERGRYHTRFTVPADWKGRRIRLVFDGVMTEAEVKVNGKPAGPVHQGGFTRFRHDITALIKFGDGAANENVLDVDVAKVCSDAKTELAERGGDYWVFGGIYRPVWLEALPAQAIDHVAIDARADGAITAEVTLGSVHGGRTDGLTMKPLRLEAQVLDAAGRPVGAVFSQGVPAGGAGRARIAGRVDAPLLWTAETPARYTLRLTYRRGDETLHVVDTRFGFRTFEVRDGEGLFLNGQRILLKGVNRHSFRPETGRALTREDCYEDVRVMRAMNMNAVRMSHYPPDEAFLEACDELGLYVLDELSGWQHAHGTAIGRLLVRELVERDVNHPSILFWDNGNEGGWNRELDGDFALYDPQQRRVLHPWNLHGGVDTKHYVSFGEFQRLLRGPNLVMPTEILHALYDGGAGAGLEDYWRAIVASPVGAGMFTWDFADEGVVRTDRQRRVDVFSTFGADGVVGPHFEKEGSYHTLRDVWSPVQIVAPVLDGKFDRSLTVHNAFDFTSLAQCRFSWMLQRFVAPAAKDRTPQVVATGAIASPAVAPHASGHLALDLPADWREADALSVTVAGPDGTTLWTWTWPTEALEKRTALPPGTGEVRGVPAIETAAGVIRLRCGDLTATFEQATGMLREIRRGAKIFALTRGPRLAFARPPANSPTEWLPLADATGEVRRLASPATASVVEVELENLRGGTVHGGFKLELSPDGNAWTTVFDASRRPGDGTRYEFPPQMVAAVRLTNLARSDGQPAALRSVRIGYVPTRFPAPVTTPPTITFSEADDPVSKRSMVWLDVRGGASGLDHARWTLHGDGALALEYRYTLDGVFAFHGVTFDLPVAQIESHRWLGEGPARVWQNRLRGPALAVHETPRRELQPGESFVYPEFEGYFAGVRWSRLATAAGPILLSGLGHDAFVRVGTPRISHPNTMADFPAGDLSFVHAIPPMGSKFKTPAESGPSAQFAKATGRYDGTVVFRFGE
ncbi:MAG: beta-galactosidase [Verrucomicrobia bacterium]|nr:beta-galactosidase [Verrucomicrobiota bacterium]